MVKQSLFLSEMANQFYPPFFGSKIADLKKCHFWLENCYLMWIKNKFMAKASAGYTYMYILYSIYISVFELTN